MSDNKTTKKKGTEAAKPAETVLVLRTCSADMTSYNGFKWPTSGPVKCDDWKPTYDCGHGLHGLLWGQGSGGYLDWSESAKWLVVEVNAADILTGDGALKDKCKFPAGVVVFCGSRDGACDYLDTHGGDPIKRVGSIQSGGYRSTVSGGDRSTVSGGYCSNVSGGYCSNVSSGYGSTVSGGDGSNVSGGDGSTVSGGDRSTVSGGDRSTVSGGDGSNVSGGDRSTVSGGDGSNVSSGDGSTVSGGDGSTVSSGDRSTVSGGDGSNVSSGYRSTVSGGDRSTVSGGDRSTVSGGDGANSKTGLAGLSLATNGIVQADAKGVLAIMRWDKKADRPRLEVAYVGENGIKANVPYRWDGKFVEVDA